MTVESNAELWRDAGGKPYPRGLNPPFFKDREGGEIRARPRFRPFSHGWQWTGIVAAAALGAIGVALTDSWLKVTIAFAVGLVAGAASLDRYATDVHLSIVAA
jgi:hypothetical protein